MGSSPALKAVVASDGMEISLHLPPDSNMAVRLRAQAERLSREPGFLIVDLIEAALGKKTDCDLIGAILATSFLLTKKPTMKRSAALHRVAASYEKRERESQRAAA